MKLSKWIGIELSLLLLGGLFFPVVWIPVFLQINSDVLMEGSAFLVFWDILQDLFSYLLYWFSVSFLAISLLRFGWKGSLPFFFGYLLASVFRRIGSILAEMIVLREFDDFSITKFLDTLFAVLVDLLLVGILLLILYLLAMRKKDPSARAGQLLPHLHLKHSPISVFVLLSVLLYYLVQLFSRVQYDMLVGGPNGQEEIFLMIFYYLYDLLFAAIGYFAVIGILQLLLKSKKKSV